MMLNLGEGIDHTGSKMLEYYNQKFVHQMSHYDPEKNEQCVWSFPAGLLAPLRQQAALLEETFSVIVCGRSNSGKSSLINYLLGLEAGFLPTSILECTAITTKVRGCKNKQEKATLYFVPDAKDLFTRKDFNLLLPIPKFVEEHMNRFPDPLPPLELKLSQLAELTVKSLKEKLDEKKEVSRSDSSSGTRKPFAFAKSASSSPRTDSPTLSREASSPGGKTPFAFAKSSSTPRSDTTPTPEETAQFENPKSFYDYLSVDVNNTLFSECPGLVLIDSPGLGRSTSSTNTTNQIAAKADMFLVVIDSGPLSEVANFVDTLKTQGKSNFLFALHKADQITPREEREKVYGDLLANLGPQGKRLIDLPHVLDASEADWNEYRFPRAYDPEKPLYLQETSIKEPQSLKILGETIRYMYKALLNKKFLSISSQLEFILSRSIQSLTTEIGLLEKTRFISLPLPSHKDWVSFRESIGVQTHVLALPLLVVPAFDDRVNLAMKEKVRTLFKPSNGLDLQLYTAEIARNVARDLYEKNHSAKIDGAWDQGCQTIIDEIKRKYGTLSRFPHIIEFLNSAADHRLKNNFYKPDSGILPSLDEISKTVSSLKDAWKGMGPEDRWNPDQVATKLFVPINHCVLFLYDLLVSRGNAELKEKLKAFQQQTVKHFENIIQYFTTMDAERAVPQTFAAVLKDLEKIMSGINTFQCSTWDGLKKLQIGLETVTKTIKEKPRLIRRDDCISLGELFSDDEVSITEPELAYLVLQLLVDAKFLSDWGVAHG